MILHGDCRTVLAGLPAQSVHASVTSPPYWGLRKYEGSEPLTWGGDPVCSHEWGRPLPAQLAGAFCQLCGAWQGDLGLEPTPDLYVQHVVEVFRAVWRVLRDDGTLWLVLGDSYARDAGKGQHKPGDSGKQAYVYDRGGGRASATVDLQNASLKPKDLVGIPWRVAFALQAAGWYLRSDIIWAKGNPMPESVKDRPARSHEYVFLLTKSERYFYDAAAVAEQRAELRGSGNLHRKVATQGQDARVNTHLGYNVPTPAGQTTRNLRSVWTIGTQPFKNAHFATFPEKLVEPCILAGTSAGGVCATCGMPFQRVYERREVFPSDAATGNEEVRHDGGDRERAPVGSGGGNVLATRRVATDVFLPACRCPPVPVPATVLDPFCGSGRAGIVAKQLGRDFIGIDLGASYVAMAQQAIDATPEK